MLPCASLRYGDQRSLRASARCRIRDLARKSLTRLAGYCLQPDRPRFLCQVYLARLRITEGRNVASVVDFTGHVNGFTFRHHERSSSFLWGSAARSNRSSSAAISAPAIANWRRRSSTLICVVGGAGTGKRNPHSIGGLLCTWTIRVLAMKYLL